MSVALVEHVNDEDIANAAGVLKQHRRIGRSTGGGARCEMCAQPWPCVRAQLAMQVQGMALAADRIGTAPVGSTR